MTVTPSARSVTSMRQRLRGYGVRQRLGDLVDTEPERPADGGGSEGVRHLVLARPAAATRAPHPQEWPARRTARPPASDADVARRGRPPPAARPNRTTRAPVRAAICATSGSSALRTATPSGASASTSSPLAGAIASTEPNSPTCARTDVEHDADVGGGDGTEVGDVADAPGAHLEDEDPRARRPTAGR